MQTLDEMARERITRILDTFTCGVLAEVEEKIVFANEKLAKMLGVPRESLWGRATRELVPPELRETLEADMTLAKAGDLRARLTAIQLYDGTSQPVLVLPMAAFKAVAPPHQVVRFGVVIDLGAVMTAKHMLYDGEEALRGQLTRIAVELQAASLLAGSSPASHPDIQHPALEELSKREREVLARLMDGDRVPTIAEKLFISPHTVRNHLKSMFRKLGVGSQAELIERVREIE